MVLILSVGLIVQVWIARTWAGGFDSDEAIIGLMSQHILQGHIPIYFYGQQYLGSLDALIAAGFLAFDDTSVIALRIGSLLTFLAFMSLHAAFVRRWWGSSASLTSLIFVALPGFRVLWYSHRANISFGTTMTLGTLALLLAFASFASQWKHSMRMVALGVVLGLGVWVHPISLTFLAVIGVTYWLTTPEWATVHGRISQWSNRKWNINPHVLGYSVALIFVALLITICFTSGCLPAHIFAVARTVATVILVGMVSLITWACLQLSVRRRLIVVSFAYLLGGLLIGNTPQWSGWLFFHNAPSLAVLPSCTSDVSRRLPLLLGTIIPELWGIPSLPSLHLQDITYLRCIVALVLMLSAFVVFFRREWGVFSRLCALSPIDSADCGAVLLGLMVGVPIFLGMFSSNVTGGSSARYMFITWQASSVVFALLLSRIAARVRWLRLVIVTFWIFQVGINSIIYLGGLWEGRYERYAPESVASLESFLQQRHVQGGYADYWMAYSLDFLTAERLTFVPYNAIDRYQPYSERVRSLRAQAYLFWRGDKVTGKTGMKTLRQQLQYAGESGPAREAVMRQTLGRRVLERRQIAGWDVWIVGHEEPRTE